LITMDSQIKIAIKMAVNQHQIPNQKKS
jgi:hypothetical protein